MVQFLIDKIIPTALAGGKTPTPAVTPVTTPAAVTTSNPSLQGLINQSSNNVDPTKFDLMTVVNLITNIINIGIILATIAASIMFLDGAFQYIIAYGDDSKAEKAKKTLIWSIVGLVVIGLAKLVVGVIEKELSNIKV